MNFLKQFLQERDTITNISCNISSSSEDEKTKQSTQVNMNCEHTQINKEKNEEVWTKPKRFKKQPEKYREPETASSTIMKYLLQKKKLKLKRKVLYTP